MTHSDAGFRFVICPALAPPADCQAVTLREFPFVFLGLDALAALFASEGFSFCPSPSHLPEMNAFIFNSI
tara:strand:- start:349 stop:558 length:210 start_codon:yes stop_codon:yes gene_type:complete